MKIKNYMEIIVDNMLEDVLRQYKDICYCDKCKADIKAIALNNLPSKYIATESGEIYSKIEALSVQFEVDVINSITKAIEKVKKFPRH